MAPNAFPADLLDAQRELHQTVAAYGALCDELPWSVAPAPGWSGDKILYSNHYRPEFPDSRGYTDAQKAQDARFRERLIELAVAVATHPYWAPLEDGVVAGRMELKQVTKQPAVLEAA